MISRRLCIFVVLCGLGLAAPLYAQFTALNLRLPQYTVQDLLQDNEGYLWLATGTGLARFDGYQLQSYMLNVDDEHSLPANLLYRLMQDSSGAIWVGTSNGVARFDASTQRFQRFLYQADATETTQGGIDVIWQGEDDRLLVGGRAGLFLFQPAGQQFIELRYQQAGIGRVFQIAQQQGQIWVASSHGLYALTPDGSLQQLYGGPVSHWLQQADHLWLVSGSWPDNELQLWRQGSVQQRWSGIRQLYQDKEGRSWAYGPSGVWRLYPDGQLAQRLEGMEVYSMLQTSGGDLLLGSTRGIFRKKPGETGWSSMPIQGVVQQNPVNGLHETADGTVFARQAHGGLARWVPGGQKFAHYQPDILHPFDSRGNNVIRHIYEQSQQDQPVLWLSTREVAKKLVLTPDHQNIVSTTLFQLPVPDARPVQLHAIQPLQSPYLLVASSLGLYLLDVQQASFELAPLNALLPASSVAANRTGKAEVLAFLAAKDCLWLATESGLGCASLDARHLLAWYGVDDYPALQQNFVHSLYQAWDGALWLSGTRGLSRFDPATAALLHFSHQPGSSNSLAHNWVHGVWQMAEHEYWVATREAGLNRLVWQPGAEAQWQRFGQADGLPSEVIYGILGDEAGWLWLSTSQGIVRFHHQSHQVRAYQPEDGVQSDEFNFSVMHQGNSGYFYFGGIHGANGFRPEQVQDNPVAPRVRLSAWSVHDTPMPLSMLSEPVRLAHHQNHLSFDYLGLHFADPARIRYRYWLEGADPTWVQAGTERHARYGALGPGHYVFWLQAANPDGVWSEPVPLQQFRILPHPLLSPLAWLLYAILLVALLLGYKRWRDTTEHRLRLRVQQGVAREAALSHHLRVQFEHTMHEMRTPLMRLATHAKRSRQLLGHSEPGSENDRLSQSLHAIAQAQEELQSLVDNQQKLEELKLQYEHQPVAVAGQLAVVSECNRLQHYAAEKQQRLDWQVAELQLLLIPGVLELITAHLLGNAIKYCPAGAAIQLSLTKVGSEALLSVQDNGGGIAAADITDIFVRHYRGAGTENVPGKGEGLFLVKTCVDNAGGRIEVSSTAAKGSCFRVYLPLATSDASLPASTAAAANSQQAELTAAVTASLDLPVAPVPDAQACKVLVVEDHDGLRHDLVAVLSQHYQVLAASSMAEGLALAQQQLPDVIVSDIMMEQKDSGLSLLSALKTSLATSHIPVVLLSALADQQSQLKGYQYQANAYLTKPASDAAILACVATQLAQSVRLTQAVRSELGKSASPAASRAVSKAKAASKPKLANSRRAAPLAADAEKARLFQAKLQGVLASCFDKPDLKVADIAKAFYKSDSEIQRLCRHYTGETVLACIQHYRFQKACSLLTSQPSASMEQIAEQSGFGTVRTLQRTFTQLYGHSPQHYRENQ